MGKFVGSNGSILALPGNGVAARIGEYDVLRVGHHSGIFHRAEAVCGRDGNLVGLLVGKWNIEVVLKPGKNGGTDLGWYLASFPWPFGVTMRTGARFFPAKPAGTKSKCPTAKATR